jgi:hypothetical protein
VVTRLSVRPMPTLKGCAESSSRDGRADRRRAGGRLGDQRRELLGELAEDVLQPRGRQPEVVVGQQRVVGPGGVVEARGVLARELDVAPQRRREGREVARGAGGLPDVLALGGGALDLRRQLAGHAPRAVEVAAGDPHDLGIDAVQPGGLELVEPGADLAGRRALVREPLQGRELLGANSCSAGRHLHLLVPAEERRRPIEILDLGDALLQLGERGFHGRNRTLQPACALRCRIEQRSLPFLVCNRGD